MNALKPINYRIRIEPDLQKFTFSGTTEILIEALAPAKELVLDALGLAFWSCRVEDNGESVECPFRVDPPKEELTILLPRAMEGVIKATVAHIGEINNGLAGFYRSKYLAEGKERVLAVTQFEESDARRAFPCFDHPREKATFDLEMVIDERLVAISNTPIRKEELLGGERKLIKFQQTPKMSSYLLFFGVGEFEFVEDSGKVTVRIATMPGMSKFARFGLEFARKSLHFCENYYNIPYPLPKLDLIAVPDFAAGAMENWGAITFRENLLLHDPAITSREGEERICEVIAHEIIHQWFGNLVSPSDWKYLWLNESFATFFSYKAVGHYHPEWEVEEQFLHSQTDPALRRDALLETFPIEIPGGAHVVVSVSTAPIIYNKGGSILRQVEGFVGNAVFQEGLRRYLKRHEYGCASSSDLWEALEEVSDKPVSALMKSWVEQPGFPLIEAKREGEKLIFSQRRFSYLPNESDQRWLVPITTRVFYLGGIAKETALLLQGGAVSMDIGSSAIAYKVNYGQTGFYRVAYQDSANLNHLGARVASKELPSVDRWGIQNDRYAAVGGAQVSMNEYLDFLSYYAQEDAYLPLAGIAGNLFHAQLVMEGPKKERVVSLGKSFLEKILATIGYEPKPQETHLLSILRDQLIFHSVVYGSDKVAAFARDAFALLTKKGVVPQDIMKSVMQVGALYGGDEAFQWFDQRLRSTESEHERMNVLAALGSFRDPSLIKKVQRYILEQVPDRNKFIPISYLATNPYAIPYMWAWFESNVTLLERFHPIHFERVIAAIVPVCGLGREERVRTFFESYAARGGKAGDAIRLSLEKLEINSRMK